MSRKTKTEARKTLASIVRAPPGTAPGTVVAHPNATRPSMRAIAFDSSSTSEVELSDPKEIGPLLEKWPVVWVDVQGLGDVEVLASLAEIFGIHRLALEDVVNTHQRPKVEQYEAHQFLVLRMISYGERLETEQISLFAGKGFVLTFQEHEGDCFDLVRERIRRGRAKMRNSGADYLAYALLDAVIDSYFPILEGYGERIEALEDLVIESPSEDCVSEIHQTKRELLSLRRSLWPLREALSSLLRDPHPVIHEETRIYLRDCYDHAVQLIDILETYRELASGLMDVYLTQLSNRMNEVMKVLTIIATIFIPLGFIAGVYGMNFDTESSAFNMPETRWKYGYAACLALMAVVAGGLLVFFRRRGWIGRSGSR